MKRDIPASSLPVQELATYVAFWLSTEGFTVNQAIRALERAQYLLSGCTFDARSFVSDTTMQHFAFLSDQAHIGEQSSPKSSSGLSGSNFGGISLAQLPALSSGQKIPLSPIIPKDTPLEVARSIIDKAGREVAGYIVERCRMSFGEAEEAIGAARQLVLKSPMVKPIWAREA